MPPRVLPSVGDEVKVIPVEKVLPAAPVSSEETTSAARVPEPGPADQAESTSSASGSLFAGGFAVVVALIALFALIKRASISPDSAK